MTARLTPDQQALFASLNTSPQPSGDQTPEQAQAAAIWGFRQACLFESLGEPSDEAILAAMADDSPYAFYRDSSDGDLVRANASGATEILGPDGWHSWQYEMTTAPLTTITREQAQALAGEGVNLDAR